MPPRNSVNVAASQRLTENRLLAGLPADVVRRIAPRLEVVRAVRGPHLHAAHEPLSHVYFPTGCLLSQFVSVRPGTSSEVVLLGRGGMLGLPVFLGADALIFTATTTIPGPVLRLPAPAFRAAIEDSPSARRFLERYTLALMVQIGQLAACRALCDVRQRVAFWLLHAADELGSEELRVTHEVLAQSLALRRATVTTALQELAATGAIDQGRGTIHLRDRRSLEGSGCACYRDIRDAYDHLLTPR